MSTYTGQGQFEDPELDRQFQDEFRRRQQQALQASGSIGTNPSLALSAGRVRPPDAYSQHHMLMAHHPDMAATGSSPYGYPPHSGIPGQPHHTSPYARMGNPYAAMDVAYAQSHGMLSGTPPTAGTSDTVAQLYAAQQRRAQAAGAYGYNAGAPASRAALEQHYATYGMTAGTPGMYYGHEGAYAAQDAAMHHQQMQDAYARSVPMLLPPSTYRPVENEGDGEKMGSPDEANSMKDKSSGSKMKDHKAKGRMLQKVTSTYTNMKTTARVVVKDGTTLIEDGEDTWYTGCIPLGVEDDKYWLSELQVYLRSNFAEAFGATEDDIAAPMHGRNKPIALGQVGIRCVHCKRKLTKPCTCYLFTIFHLTEILREFYRGESRRTWAASDFLS